RIAGAMKSGPTSSGRSSKNRDFGRGATTAIAVMADVSALGALGVAPIPIEIAQLRLAHREHVPSAGRNAVERRMRWQLGRHLAFRGSAVERAIQDMLRAEVLHAVDAERELDDRAAVEQLLGRKFSGRKPIDPPSRSIRFIGGVPRKLATNSSAGCS